MNLIPITSPCFLEPELLTTMPDWQQVFANHNPVALEIGSGMGDFVAKMAALHPDWNFIAIDYYNKGCLKTCKRIDKAGLDNVRVVRDEARAFLERCIQRESLRGVIINCPDPWPKLRHRKRRLVNSGFTAYLSHFMRPEADFYFATDFVDYGLDVAEFMVAQPGFINQLAPETYRHHLGGYPVSKYMRRFLDMGQPIYYVHYRVAGGETS